MVDAFLQFAMLVFHALTDPQRSKTCIAFAAVMMPGMFTVLPKVSCMTATHRRPLATFLMLAAFAIAPAHAEDDCAARIDAGLASIKRAEDVQRTREAANDLQLNRELCQGRLDVLDARFALSDDFEACRRKGVAFSDAVVRTLTQASNELADSKASWIRTCARQMQD